MKPTRRGLFGIAAALFAGGTAKAVAKSIAVSPDDWPTSGEVAARINEHSVTTLRIADPCCVHTISGVGHAHYIPHSTVKNHDQ